LIQKTSHLFDPELLLIFRDKVLKLDELIKSGRFKPKAEEESISIPDLNVGHILSKNVLDTDNRLVVARGTVISAVLRMRLINYVLSKKIERTAWIYSKTPKI
jgi:hypothetical protein